MSHLLSSLTIWLRLVRLVIDLLSTSWHVYKDCPTTHWDLKSQFCFHNPSLLSIRILVLLWELSECWETLNLWYDFELAVCKFSSWSQLRTFHVSCCTLHKGPTWNLNKRGGQKGRTDPAQKRWHHSHVHPPWNQLDNSWTDHCTWIGIHLQQKENPPICLSSWDRKTT